MFVQKQCPFTVIQDHLNYFYSPCKIAYGLSSIMGTPALFTAIVLGLRTWKNETKPKSVRLAIPAGK